MEAKIHKDVVLFKRILTHDKFGDHVEEVRSNWLCHLLVDLNPEVLQLPKRAGHALFVAGALSKHHMFDRRQNWCSPWDWQSHRRATCACLCS